MGHSSSADTFLSDPATDDEIPSESSLLEALSTLLEGAQLQTNVRLAPYTTFKIGGPADLFYTATSSADLANAVDAASALDVPYFVLGTGANILVGDRGFRGLVIRNRATHTHFHDDGRLWVESGATVGELIPQAVDRGLSGLEHYVGIPSTIGGAMWQNLHFLSPAPERERTMFIEEIVDAVDVLGVDGTRRTLDREAMQFGYDTSILHTRHDVVLSVNFRLTPSDRGTLQRIMQENLSWRGSRHPWLDIHPSAGSIFKKIEGVGAGRLIDACGLKGFQHGGAQISHIHANIMINVGHATARDVRELIEIAQQAVWEKHHQRLEPEIGFIGEFKDFKGS